MADTTITFRADELIKQNFEKVCSDVGLNMTTAFNVFMRATIRDQGLPFVVGSKATTTMQQRAVMDFIYNINNISDNLSESDFEELASGKYKIKFNKELDL